jgi:transcriptional regulator with XRE-family HTH domain
MLKTKLKPVTTTLGRRLRDARVFRGLTQDELGVAIGLDEGNACIRVGRYESGQVTPPLAVLGRLAQALQVPVAFFVAETDELAGFYLQVAQLSDGQFAELGRQVENMLGPDRNG